MDRCWIAISAIAMLMVSGCQCCPLFDSYANFVDDVSDTHLYFDRLYYPRWDITRMGKPDWCSPFNNHFCPRCCQNGCYDRYDDCYLYPPSYPFELPSNIMPPPTVRTTRPAQIYEEADVLPSHGNKPATSEPPAPMPETN